jgi:hypothetical protein
MIYFIDIIVQMARPGLFQSDNINQMITLTVITLSLFHCGWVCKSAILNYLVEIF